MLGVIIVAYHLQKIFGKTNALKQLIEDQALLTN